MAYSDNWNPITSRNTKKVEVREDGAVIYSHTVPFVAGSFVTVWDRHNWVASDTIEEAREVVR